MKRCKICGGYLKPRDPKGFNDYSKSVRLRVGYQRTIDLDRLQRDYFNYVPRETAASRIISEQPGVGFKKLK